MEVNEDLNELMSDDDVSFQKSFSLTFLARYDSFEKVKEYFKLLKFRTRTTQMNKSACRYYVDFGTLLYRIFSSKICVDNDDDLTNCPARYKIISCDSENIHEVYTSNEHIGADKETTE
ncbi:hypothetical protein BpHYR1_011404 [Brachionus plicatilis]|uniref:Uncharacterized protein n=1 Tax=Brachionus plicatilis TaxID=10195 RepID=A0A3M7RPZ8_BRAPC|nr:hypothetical protein BpHYR1_011404 [Brachionus plicatilis]